MQYSDKHSTDVLMPIMREVDELLAKHKLVTWEKQRILMELLAENAVDIARSWDYDSDEWANLCLALTADLQNSMTGNMTGHLKAEAAAEAGDTE